jgi:hypothetical protein
MVAMSGNPITLHNVRLHPAKTALVTYYISIRSSLSILQPVVKLCHLAFTAVPPCLQRYPILRPSPSTNIYYHILRNEVILTKNAEVTHLDSWIVFFFLVGWDLRPR